MGRSSRGVFRKLTRRWKQWRPTHAQRGGNQLRLHMQRKYMKSRR